MKYIVHTTFSKKEIKKINEAMAKVPLYKNNKSVSSYEDMQKIKIYDKEEIRNNWEQCVSESLKIEDLRVDYTSGSTGKPLKIARTDKDINLSKKYIWKYRNQLCPGALKVKHVEFGRNMRYFIQNPNETILEKGKTLFIKGILSKENIKEYIQILNDYQPKWLLGPASFLVQFVELADKYGQLNIQPQFIESAGEYLFPNSKFFLEKYFNCPVVSHYGSREIWPLALECTCGKMHIVEENVFMEIINPNSEHFGEILVSSLQIESMPLIRYRIGDIGRICDSTCMCGNKNKVLELTGARMNDYAETIQGKKVGAFFFSTIFVDQILRKGYKGILNWKVIQKEFNKFEVQIVKNCDYKYDVENIVTENIKKEFSNAEIQFLYKDNIDLENNGKMKYFINEVSTV